MPGLLQAPNSKFGSAKSVVAVAAEFLGTLVFTFAGTTTPTGVTSTQQSVGTASQYASNWAPWGNGFALVLAVYATANVSGGHINPAVTAATMVTGHINLLLGCCYIIAQLSGACVAILLVWAWVMLVSAVFTLAGASTKLFGWELVMTFVLVAVVYAVAIGEPSFGVVGPFIVGLSLFTMVFAGSQYTGTAINPARAFGPAAVFHCYWNEVWIYALAEFSGGILAGLISCPLYGVGSPLLKKLMPWMHADEEPEGPSGKLVSKSVQRANARAAARRAKQEHSQDSPMTKHPRPTDEAPILEGSPEQDRIGARVNGGYDAV